MNFRVIFCAIFITLLFSFQGDARNIRSANLSGYSEDMSLELDWGALLRHEMVSSKFPMNGVTNLLRNMAKLGIRYIDLSKLPLDARTLIKVSVRVYIYIYVYICAVLRFCCLLYVL